MRDEETEWYYCAECEETDCEYCGHGFDYESDPEIEDEVYCPCCGSQDVQP